jgi:hypothetical protein
MRHTAAAKCVVEFLMRRRKSALEEVADLQLNQEFLSWNY